MPKPIRIHADIYHADERARRTMKDFTSHQLFDRSLAAIHVEIEIQNFFPHGWKKTQMPLLPCVLLRDLQFDTFVCFLQPAEKRRHWFPSLEVNWSILDLDDDVVVEFRSEEHTSELQSRFDLVCR